MLLEGLHNKIFLAGLLSCFRGKQKNIKVAQVIDRRFTPTESLTRIYLSHLVRENIINVKAISDIELLLVDPWKIDQATEIEVKNIPRNEYGQLTLSLIKDIKGELATDLSNLHTMQRILLEILAAECVEYAEFYCNKEVAQLEVYQPDNPRLMLMLQEISQGQVFMLIWRAVKNLAKPIEGSTDRTIQFEDIIDLAHEYSIKYDQLDISIENYNRPKIFKTSRLANIILNDILNIDSDHISYVGMNDYLLASRTLQHLPQITPQ